MSAQDGATVPSAGSSSPLLPLPDIDAPRIRDDQPLAALIVEPSHEMIVESVTPAELSNTEVAAPATSRPSKSASPDDSDTTPSAPYGTRSQRTTGQRPNYAEDKDVDGDTEMNGTGKTGSIRKSGTAPVRAAPDLDEDNSSRRGFSAINAPQASPPAKDLIPGTSTFVANPSTSAASKKRKQPGSTTASSSAAPQSHTTRLKNATTSRSQPENNMMSFTKSKGFLNASGQLKADDGTTLAVNDHAYFVCEPPGEPYYLARIMAFVHAKGVANGPVESLRVNWYYRPKDIQRKVQDTRVVFASMHSDPCPLTSLRGKCVISHLSEIRNLDEYRVMKDCFWFDKLFDRYIHRYYEVIPTAKVINVPQHVKKVLDERWKFVLVEIGRGKELTSAVKTCKKCSGYAASITAVDCAVCKNTYHMTCVRPVLTKKPARGFAWACAACNRAQEKKLEARHTPNVGETPLDGEEDIVEEEEDDGAGLRQSTRASSTALEERDHPPATAEQIAQAAQWPYRYLGIHSKPEDALDYDDRIYPRASSRLGPRHQANIMAWTGRPIEFVKPSEIRKKYIKPPSHKKDASKLSKESVAILEADGENRLKRPKWVMDEPVGYIARGEDFPVDIKGKKEKENTAATIFKMPDASHFTSRGENGPDQVTMSPDARGQLVDDYMKRVKGLAPQYGLPGYSTNFLTKAVEKLCEKDYDVEAALSAMKLLHLRNDLKEPDLSKEEIKRFEDGVAKFGSELHHVSRHVGSGVKHARIVRFYYMWKKTERGKQIWGNYEGRKSKKESKKLDEAKQREANASKLVDDVADDQDDSAFDGNKADSRRRGFVCKFCTAKKSRQWRRAPATAPGTLVSPDSTSKASKDRSNWLILALCGRCAYLWRRYAIQFESIEEVSKKIAAAGGRASKRRIDEELMRAIVEAQEESGDTISSSAAAVAASAGVNVPATIIRVPEPAKKKAKTDKDGLTNLTDVEKKKLVPEKPAEPLPLKAEPPRVKTLPCAICSLVDLPGDDYLSCRDCRLAVHKSCYGIHRDRNPKKWYCDMCSNDRNTLVSTTYECILCPVIYTPHELMEPPKISHKKKTDREREKERKEKEMVEEAVRLYRQQQDAAGRPSNPREALKRTAWNNWIHVTCALWTPEIKFGHSEHLEPAEGMGFIPLDRYSTVCKFCKTSGKKPVVSCQFPSCNAQFHVGCAHQAGNGFGFDMTPVKGSRRDVVTTVKLGDELGSATAAIWCAHHPVQNSQHAMVEGTDEGITALQLFARSYKQVDETTTGTVRRAAQFLTQGPFSTTQVAVPISRRASLLNGTKDLSLHSDRASLRNSRDSLDSATRPFDDGPATASNGTALGPDKDASGERRECVTCKTLFSPKWWPIRQAKENTALGLNESRPPLNGVSVETEIRPGTSLEIQSPRINSSPRGLGLGLAPAVLNGVTKTDETASKMPGGWRAPGDEPTPYQCHKCHVTKRAPPASPPLPSRIDFPSLVGRRSPPAPVSNPTFQPPTSYSGPSDRSHSHAHRSTESPWPHHTPTPPTAPASLPPPPTESLRQWPPEYPAPPSRNGLRPAPQTMNAPNGLPHGSPPYSSRPPPVMNGYLHSHHAPAPPAPPPHSHPPAHHVSPHLASYQHAPYSPPSYPRPTNAHLYSTSPGHPPPHTDHRVTSPTRVAAHPVPRGFHPQPHPFERHVSQPQPSSSQHSHSRSRGHSLDGYGWPPPPATPCTPPLQSAPVSAREFDSARDYRPDWDQDRDRERERERDREWERGRERETERERARDRERERDREARPGASASPSVKNLLS